MSKDCESARKLAALLFEYMMPGLRHQSFPTRAPKTLVYAPFARTARYQTTKQIVNRFQLGYAHNNFTQYVDSSSHWTQSDLDKKNENRLGTFPIRCATPPREVSFEQVLAELRISTALIQWIHRGENQIWLGHAKHQPVVREFLLSADHVRKRMLLHPEQHLETCPLTKLYTKDLGVDYKMRIGKLRRRLPWFCKQFLVREKGKQMNLSLTPSDVHYLVDLYELKI
mmetsp:Transcript_30667/g.74301  ORF Transcript_30667/g.74301 Transcript_30667/m.74301 type:complete len:227 (-) Transcript_30667:532-1212(-)